MCYPGTAAKASVILSTPDSGNPSFSFTLQQIRDMTIARKEKYLQEAKDYVALVEKEIENKKKAEAKGKGKEKAKAKK